MRTRTVIAQVIASASSLLGCNSGIDPADFDRVSCDQTDLPLKDLQGDLAYIEARYGNYGTWGQPESLGAICSDATDKPLCEGAHADFVENAQSGVRFGQSVSESNDVLVSGTAGNEVVALDTKNALVERLQPIDSPEKAIAIVHLSGYFVNCMQPEESGVRQDGDTFEVLAAKITASCDPIEKTAFVLRVNSDGSLEELESEVIESESGACIGRRPAGLRPQPKSPGTDMGRYLATVAHLEAASVLAFARLSNELRRFGAPARLVRLAERARRDEVRHARVMAGLARVQGSESHAPQCDQHVERSFEEFAYENATEGCVVEMFGAVVGRWQSERASDPAVVRAMKGIAQDEANHAQLAWEVHQWVLSVRPDLADALTNLQVRALERLVPERAGSARAALGLPDAHEHAVLRSAFHRALAPALAA